MSLQLTLHKEGEFVRLAGPVIKHFHATIRHSVRPHGQRRFDKERQQWSVHWKWLPFITNLSKRYFFHVDWSRLPADWQMYAVGAASPESELALPTPEPDFYAILHVTEDAPNEVVKAARNALVLLYHSDHGSDDRKAADVISAYKRICELRGN